MILITFVKILGYLIIIRPLIIKLSITISIIGLLSFLFWRNSKNFAGKLLMAFSMLSLIPYIFVDLRFVIGEFMIIARAVLSAKIDFILMLKKFWLVEHDPIFWGISISSLILFYSITSKHRSPSLLPLNDEETLKIVNSVSSLLKIPPPKVYVLNTAEPQLYTNANRSKPYIAISVGAFETFNRDELIAAITHELAHIANNDNENFLFSLISLAGTVFNFLNIINFFLIKIESEYAADESAAKMVGIEPLVSALLKVSGIEPSWHTGSGFVPSKFDLLLFTPPVKKRIARLLNLYKRGLLPKQGYVLKLFYNERK